MRAIVLVVLCSAMGCLLTGDDGGDTPTPRIGPGCYVGGCSGHDCSDHEVVVTTCESIDLGAECYLSATCELQATGECGWTDTAELNSCLAVH